MNLSQTMELTIYKDVPWLLVQGIVNTADFQLSGFQSTSEMFPFNPPFSDSSWILYVAATLFPTPSLYEYLPFSG